MTRGEGYQRPLFLKATSCPQMKGAWLCIPVDGEHGFPDEKIGYGPTIYLKNIRGWLPFYVPRILAFALRHLRHGGHLASTQPVQQAWRSRKSSDCGRARAGGNSGRTSLSSQDQVAKDKALQTMAAMSSAQLVSATVLQEKLGLSESHYPPSTTSTEFFQFWGGDANQPRASPDVKPILQAPYPIPSVAAPSSVPGYHTAPGRVSRLPTATSWQGSHIGTETLRLVEFTAFVERQGEQDACQQQQHRFVHIDPTPTSDPPLEMVDVRQIYDKFPERGGGLRDLYDQGPPHAFFLVKFWADLSFPLLEEEPGGTGGTFYGVSSRYEGPRALTLSCTSKVCSFGKQVVEKLETAEPPHWEDGRFVFRLQRSPLCEYLINFIRKLQTLPEKPMMDSVLENFTILQVLRDQETQELLLCVAFVFEVSANERGAQHHIYRLGRD
ncbi:Transcriptional enhancer factor TEF-4 [Varanus komodoensis]|nr:Transcriptional enhancer factor TEF-4 [Varanus komodoensis]